MQIIIIIIKKEEKHEVRTKRISNKMSDYDKEADDTFLRSSE